MAKVCLYHGSDLDGICSAAIIKHRYPDVKLYPVEYGDAMNYDSMFKDGDDVYVVDFTLHPFGHMNVINNSNNLTWIDHHETSIIDYELYKKNERCGEIEGVRDINKSACELTWEYIYPDIPVPYTVWLLGRYDVWEHHASKSILPFQFGMMLNHKCPESETWWNKIFTEDRDDEFIQKIIREGKTIIRYRDRLNKKLCEIQSFESTLNGYKCLCINRALCGSIVFDSVWNPDKYDMMVVFYICNKGAWNVSLYTDGREGDVNVGEIAKEYGGGGHAGAAGFRCSILPFDVNDN